MNNHEADAFCLNEDSGFIRHNKIRVVEIGSDFCKICVKLSSENCNIYGFPHGGLLFTMADAAAGALARSHALAPCVTVNASISFIRSTQHADQIFATSHSVRECRELLFYEVNLTDDIGTLLAVMSVTMKRLYQNSE